MAAFADDDAFADRNGRIVPGASIRSQSSNVTPAATDTTIFFARSSRTGASTAST
jgi:hypothetical protein